jgi:hypothetical protein
MKSKIFMYLFLFTALFVVFQYANSNKALNQFTNQIDSLKKEVSQLKDSLQLVEDKNFDLQYFSLEGNEDALAYFNNLDVTALVTNIKDKVYEYNESKGDNPLVPYAGMSGDMKINKVKLLNHQWMISDFSDGKYWGELLLKYSYDNNTQEITIERIAELLYSPR